MAKVSRLNDMTTGHDDYPPQVLLNASPDVVVDGVPAARIYDMASVHCDSHDCHSGSVANSSNSVYANGLGLSRVGDAISCGGYIATGCSTVECG